MATYKTLTILGNCCVSVQKQNDKKREIKLSFELIPKFSILNTFRGAFFFYVLKMFGKHESVTDGTVIDELATV